ncbi:DUF397 domain-containing protein [Actinomadura violacea]|uniref:DUF397 domain-containing protein n=1 Tax=Actinomadura violacea TaxID=2819934 RepID=A0ABS3RHG3_9ACTN|nr:DUF397 domain-containing protein [Actinomadura violacea]MBO2456165.1 DUF397 domain-containing protein [Actinomadura violacea]
MDLTSVLWRKSSMSTNNGGACVELASVSRSVAIRDSKDPDGPKLVFDRHDFAAFLERVKR